MTQLIPTGDRLLIEKLPDDDMTKSGIYMPQTRGTASLHRGRVLAVGPGLTYDNGIMVAVPIPIGSVVLYPAGHAVEIEDDGEKVAFVTASSVLAIVKEEVIES